MISLLSSSVASLKGYCNTSTNGAVGNTWAFGVVSSNVKRRVLGWTVFLGSVRVGDVALYHQPNGQLNNHNTLFCTLSTNGIVGKTRVFGIVSLNSRARRLGSASTLAKQLFPWKDTWRMCRAATAWLEISPWQPTPDWRCPGEKLVRTTQCVRTTQKHAKVILLLLIQKVW